MQPPIFKLEAFFDEFEFEPNMNVLGSSDAQTWTVKELLAMSDQPLAFLEIPLSYQDVTGDKVLRAAVAEMYRPAKIGPENVLITTGATEAIFLSLYTSLEEGDVALLCRPVFQSVFEVARMAGADVEFYDYVEGDDFQPDLKAVHTALERQAPPKVLFLNTPHNPTGRAIDEPRLKALLIEAQNSNVTVIVNEMYSDIWLPPTKPVPSAATFDSGAVVIAGLSKVFGLAGLRIGWLVGPTALIQRCKNLRYYTTLCPPAILQNLGEIAVRNRQQILDRTRQVVQQNFEAAMQWLDNNERFFEWVKPDAGQVMLIRLKHEMETRLFVRELAIKASVLLISCTDCFNMRQGYLRLGLGGEPSRFADGLTRLSDFVKNLK